MIEWKERVEKEAEGMELATSMHKFYSATGQWSEFRLEWWVPKREESQEAFCTFYPLAPSPFSITYITKGACREAIWTAAPDGVLDYASALLNDGLLLLEFRDTIREGDGPRILRCWKVLLMYFQYAKHKNYQKEAFHLLAGVSAAALEHIAHQLTWSRVVNTSGGKGKNVPLDLHMEHLNRTVKDHIANLGANIAEKSILQCGESLKWLIETCKNFDEQMQTRSSSKHTKGSDANDEKVILKELTKTSSVFDYVPGRVHPSFKAVRPSTAEHIDKAKLLWWIKGKKKLLQDSVCIARVFIVWVKSRVLHL